jgi:LysM repeat protein
MHSPKHRQYRVKRGDTLSAIALRQYGNAAVWPELARVNNLPNGNLILVGMTLQLPSILVQGAPSAKTSAPSAKTSVPTSKPSFSSPPPQGPFGTHSIIPGSSGNTPFARPVLFPTVKYSLSGLPEVSIALPNVEYRLKLVGDISISQKSTMTEIEFSASKPPQLSAKLKNEYDTKFIKMASDLKVKWDPASKSAEISCGFTIATKINGKAFVTHEYKAIPPNKLKYTVSPQDVEGEIGDLIFKGKFGYELEITIKNDFDSKPRMSPISLGVPSVDTGWVIIGGLVLLGTAIIVADIAKDVATLGVGAAESPISFAAAFSLFSQAAALAR